SPGNPNRPPQVLGALERLQSKLVQKEEWTHSATLGNLRETLQSPLFSHILTLQYSLRQLQNQVRLPLKNLAVPCAVDPSSCSTPPLSGRQTELISLTRSVSDGLGFSVVGLNPTGTASQGVFVKHIQPGGIAHRDGRLRERDQILVINGSPVEPGMSHQQALSLLQQPGETQLVVARDWSPEGVRSLSSVSSLLLSVLLPQGQWGHVEEIQLFNDGSGLGFGIVGGKTTGVVVRTLIPNSVADRDGRLRTGDHILRIGSTPTSGLTSDQVVKVLQACGSHVTMLIARDPQGQKAAASAAPPPPDSAPIANLPPPLPDSSPITSLAPPLPESHVVPGSAADQSGNIRVHDRLLALDLLSVLQQDLSGSSPVYRYLCVFLCPASDAELRAKWEAALGPQYQVLVVNLDPVIEDDEELQKSSKLLPIHILRLGVELDSFDGHHYISSVAPGGPVDKHGVLRPEDELLEVTVFPRDLSGSSFCQEQVSTLVLQLETEESDLSQEEEDEEEDDDGELALWSPEVNVVELQKQKDKGLGFSILDYQDPLDPGRCVMVIRSLVPGGSAERHGGLLPGDQLVSVNQTQLDPFTLTQAVEVLKAVPPGTVRLGIRKPLVELSNRSVLPEYPKEEDEEEEEEELILDGGLPRYTSSLTSDLQPVEEGTEMAVDEEEVEAEDVMNSLHRMPPPSFEEWQLSSSAGRAGGFEEVGSVLMFYDLPEREAGEGEETPAFSHWGPPRRVEVWPEDGQSLGLSIVGGRHVIKRLKNGEELKGIFIKQVLPNSPAAKSHCLKTGDKILEVSGVDLRTASHEEAVSAIKSAPSPVVFIVQSLSATPRVTDHTEHQDSVYNKSGKVPWQ
uniref:PATJ crumbs cell polarity complex component n=1 Tax=Cyprinodon variegatus TaxID=28743 RepID=A0A3Q2E3W3_CYPVA